MPQTDVRPSGLDTLAFPSNGFTLTLTWTAGYLAGKTWEATLGDEALDVDVVGDVMTIAVSGEITGDLGTGRHVFALRETTGALDQTRIRGRVLLTESSTSNPDQTVTVTTVDEIDVAVTVASGEPGVPAGGTTGQALVKASDTDFDTEWTDVAGAGHPDLAAHNTLGLATQAELDAEAATRAAADVALDGRLDTIEAISIATDAELAAAVEAHRADTTNVHGIADTADLVLTDDARLSDARTPTAHAASHQDGGADELAIDGSQITTGTVADARIAATIARDSEVTAAVAAHVDDAADAHDASAVSVVPAGGIASTTVQAALEELDTEKSATGHDHDAAYLSLAAADERIDDRVASLLVAGTNITLTYNDVAGTLTIDAAGGGGGGLTQEQAEDIVAALIDDNSDLDWTYDDATASLVAVIKPGSVTNAMLAGGIDLAKLATDPLARANHTGTQTASTISDLTEAVQDLVGAMATDGTTVNFTYDDTAGTLTAEVQGLTSANLSDFAEAVRDRLGATLVAGAGITVTVDDPGDTVTITAEVTQAELDAVSAAIPNTEAIQDIVGGMVSGNTETGIAVTYDDTNGKLDFVTDVLQAEVDAKANDADVVHDTGDETIAGVKTFSSDPLIPDEAYDATAWNGVLEPPTKNAVRDVIEGLSGTYVSHISGLTANGIADDRATIQAALDAAPVGSTVRMPNVATCLVGDTIHVPSGVTFDGNNVKLVVPATFLATVTRYTETIVVSRDFAAVVATDQRGAATSDVKIKNVRVDCGDIVWSAGDALLLNLIGVWVNDSNRALVESCRVDDVLPGAWNISSTRQFGLLVSYADDVLVSGGRYTQAGYECIGLRDGSTHVRVVGATAHGGGAHAAQSATGTVHEWVGCLFDQTGAPSPGPSSGLMMDLAGEVSVVACSTRACRISVFNGSDNITIDACRVESPAPAIDILGSTSRVTKVTVSNCPRLASTGSTGNVVRINEADDVTLIGNHIEGTVTDHIEIDDATAILIALNQITGTASDSGIHFLAATVGAVVHGNTIVVTAGAGIRADAGTDYTIGHNQISMASGRGVDLRGGTLVTVTGNGVRLTAASGTRRCIYANNAGPSIIANTCTVPSGGSGVYIDTSATLALVVGNDLTAVVTSGNRIIQNSSGHTILLNRGALLFIDGLLDDATASDARTTLGLGTAAVEATATLLARANHTGTQLAATISDFDTQVATTAALRGFAGQWPSGSYLQNEGPLATLTMVANRLYFAPLWIPTARTLSEISIDITVSGAANSVIRVGLFLPDANGRPGTLLLDAGTIDGTQAPGILPKTGLAQAVPRGLIWVGVCGQGGPATQPVIRVLSGVSRYVNLTTVTTVSSRTGHYEAGVTGAFTNATPDVTVQTVAPLVLLKAA